MYSSNVLSIVGMVGRQKSAVILPANDRRLLRKYTVCNVIEIDLMSLVNIVESGKEKERDGGVTMEEVRGHERYLAPVCGQNRSKIRLHGIRKV